jgi:hypothetical protein
MKYMHEIYALGVEQLIYNRKGLYDELAMIAEMDQAETGLQVNTCNKHVDIKFSAHDAFLQSLLYHCLVSV